MNFFAHLILAERTVHSRVGNLLGDFARGVDTTALAPEVYAGLQNHRRVDHFTDHHPQVRVMKQYFSPQRRRFSGIALDVLFDHFLMQHWSQYSDEPLDRVIDDLYRDLEQGQSLMPERMRLIIMRMIEQDWFSSYLQLEGVAFALDRIASRIRFQHRFAGIGAELEQYYPELELQFRQFIPDLFERFPSPYIVG